MAKRRIKPRTPRYQWYFLQRESANTVDAFGEPTEAFTYVTSGLFAFERAKRPIEAADAGATVDNIQYIIIGAYTKHYAEVIKSDLIAWCPALDNLVVELIGDAIDIDGYQEQLWTYAMKNVSREYNTASFPTAAP